MSDNSSVIKMIDEVRKRIRKDLFKGKLNYDSSMATLKRHAEVAEQMGEWVLLGQVFETLGTIEIERGNLQSAQEFYQKGHDAFAQINDEGRMGVMLNNLGEVYRQMGDYEEAARLYMQAREIAVRTHRYTTIIHSYNNEGQARLSAGQVDEAIALLNRGLVINTESGEWNVDIIQSTLPEIHSSLARAYTLKQDYPQAWENVQRALEIATEFTQVTQMARANQTMAFIAMHDPQFTGSAEEFFNQSRSLWLTLEARVELGRLYALEGDYWMQRSNIERAQNCYLEGAGLLDDAQLHAEAEAIRQRIT